MNVVTVAQHVAVLNATEHFLKIQLKMMKNGIIENQNKTMIKGQD